MLLVAAALLLRQYDVALPTTARFAAYLGLGVVLPGTLLWRALMGRAGPLVVDAAAGAALGYTVEVLVYIAARWAGAPLLVLAWPVGMVTLALLVPRLRRYWRGAPGRRTPAAWSWSMAAVIGLFLFRSIRQFRWHDPGWPVGPVFDADTPFHWALIGEAKYHMPMQAPWVSGERLVYHWFVYPEMAATSWVTGIDPLTLLLRLAPMPMFAAQLVLVAAIAQRLTGRRWTGPAAAVATLLALAPDPYGWPLQDGWFGFGPVEDGSVYRLTTWTSPTQTFGALLFAALMLVLVDVLQPATGAARPRNRGRWVLLGLLLTGVSGAKAPYLPMLAAALVGALLVRGLLRLGGHRRLIGLAALVAGFTVVSTIVLYGGGSSQAFVVQPLEIMSSAETEVAAMTGFTTPDAPFRRPAMIAALTVLCWLFVWAGTLALGIRRRWLEPAVQVLLWVGLTGMAGVLLLGHPGGSQAYLIVSARPYLAILSVAGLSLAAGAGPRRRGTAWLLAAAVAAGAATVWLVRTADGPAPPVAGKGVWLGRLGWELAWPYLALAGGVAAVAAVLLAARAMRRLRGRAAALLVCYCAGFGLVSGGDAVAAIVTDVTGPYASGGWHAVDPAVLVGPDGRVSAVDRDTYAAGRWLQAHTGPGDLLATNAHCFGLSWPTGQCDNRRFALSAAAQRRVLVEGWGFTNSAYVVAARTGAEPWFADYWDARRLADNDAAFTRPSTATVGLLRDRYGVHWLIVDASVAGATDLSAVATPRYTSGVCTVYEVHR